MDLEERREMGERWGRGHYDQDVIYKRRRKNKEKNKTIRRIIKVCGFHDVLSTESPDDKQMSKVPE